MSLICDICGTTENVGEIGLCDICEEFVYEDCYDLPMEGDVE